MNKPLALIATASLAAASLWALHHRGDAPASGNQASLLADRLWLDHVPRNDKETVNIFVLVSDQAHGVFQAMSAWRGQYEVFGFEANGADLRLTYPQTGERERATARARRCDEDGMDFCLEVTGASRGVKKYYSRKGWEIDAHGKDARSIPALVEQRVESLR